MTSYCNYRCEASFAHTEGMGSNDTVGLLSANNRFYASARFGYA